MFGVFNMYERNDLHESLPSFAQLTEHLAHSTEGISRANPPPRLAPMPAAYYNSPESTESHTSMYVRSPALVGSPGMRPAGIPPAGTPSYLRSRDTESFSPTSAVGPPPWWSPRLEQQHHYRHHHQHHVHSSHYDTPRSSSPLPVRLAPLRTDNDTIQVSTDPETTSFIDEDMIRLPVDMPINYGETLDALANSAIAIYDFARRCNADRHCSTAASASSTSRTSSSSSTTTTSKNGEDCLTTTHARLPSKRVVNMMAYNGDIIKKRMEDIKKVRRYIESRNNKNNSGSGELASNGNAPEKAAVPTTPRKGRKRIREHVRDVDGKKTIGAPNPAGKCYNCGCTESTEWRRGPEGQRTLCNKCGLQYSKSQRGVTRGDR
ncbi:hypothetical protein QBC43DRAFT_329608 [Cladorrhinum sp. PSN259]|nr:hypothetical protein QBC43DRAFT_329608 [Cladorrhinum sp. PSN259]